VLPSVGIESAAGSDMGPCAVPLFEATLATLSDTLDMVESRALTSFAPGRFKTDDNVTPLVVDTPPVVPTLAPADEPATAPVEAPVAAAVPAMDVAPADELPAVAPEATVAAAAALTEGVTIGSAISNPEINFVFPVLAACDVWSHRASLPPTQSQTR